MAHQRKSELNRFIQEGVDPEIPWGLPSDDAHPDGEPHANTAPPGAPEPGSLSEADSVDEGKVTPAVNETQPRNDSELKKSA